MKFDDKFFIAQKIKTYRKKQGLTQEKLAELIDLSVQHVSRIENGCYIPSLKTFFMIISVLNIDLREFGFNPKSTNNPTRDKLIEKIVNATDTELIFYDNMTTAIGKSLSDMKQKLL